MLRSRLRPPRHAGDRDLAKAIKRFKIPRQPFEDLILGLEMDLNHAGYETFQELSQYCYRVASTIGLICIEIFGYQNPRTRDYAVNLGMALQLVNTPGQRRGRAKSRQGRLRTGEDQARAKASTGE